MSFFKKILGRKRKEVLKEKNKSSINWLPLTTIDGLKDLEKTSKTQSVLIFKHSTRCGISSIVMKQFESLFSQEYQNLKVYYLDILNYRTISDQIEYSFKIPHESPQLIVLKNGISVYNASHYDITLVDLSRFI